MDPWCRPTPSESCQASLSFDKAGWCRSFQFCVYFSLGLSFNWMSCQGSCHFQSADILHLGVVTVPTCVQAPVFPSLMPHHFIIRGGILTIPLMYLSESLVHRPSTDAVSWNICLTGVVWPLVPLAYTREKGVNDMYFSPSIIINRERSAPAQPHGTATTAVNSQSCSKPYK